MIPNTQTDRNDKEEHIKRMLSMGKNKAVRKYELHFCVARTF